MGVLSALGRAVAGPDHRPAPPRSRRRARIMLYGAPLGLLALVGFGFANREYLEDHRVLDPVVLAVFSVWSVLPVAVAVRWPLLAWRIAYPFVFLGVFGAGIEEPWPWSPVQIFGFFFVLLRVALREESGVIAWVTMLTLIPVLAFAPTANTVGAVLAVVAVALAGDVVSRRRRGREALAEQTALTELEKARRAVLEERARIAREMHDVVAHHMSLIAVQAETAPYRVTGLPPPALEEFSAIAAGARDALSEMRRLLGVLRSETGESLRAPQPGLADVSALVETTGRAGVAVTLNEAEQVAEVPEAVGLAAYRIVQEALANAARHAPGGPVLVSIGGSAKLLHVEVGNGPGAPTVPAAGPGHGLVGMRERVALLGGTLRAGPRPDGGYQVAARLPLTDDHQPGDTPPGDDSGSGHPPAEDA